MGCHAAAAGLERDGVLGDDRPAADIADIVVVIVRMIRGQGQFLRLRSLADRACPGLGPLVLTGGCLGGDPVSPLMPLGGGFHLLALLAHLTDLTLYALFRAGGLFNHGVFHPTVILRIK